MKVQQPNNRPKSKNNPNGKAKAVNVDWHAYYERRNAEGIKHGKLMADIADYTRELLEVKKDAYDRRVSAILVSILDLMLNRYFKITY